MNLKNYLVKKLDKVISTTWPHITEEGFAFDVSYPPDATLGHYTTNVAMRLASKIHRNPKEVGEQIATALGRMPAFEKVEVVGPGFINLFIRDRWLMRQVPEIVTERKRFGCSLSDKGTRVQVEFISANPTGPLHIGNGRGGFTGDVLANVLQLTGHTVQREYYINDVGKQAGILAESVLRRYWQHKGINVKYPDYCYQGDYVKELAEKLYLPNYTFGTAEKIEDIRERIKGRILNKMISSIKKLAEKKFAIKYNRWFSEKSLYTSGTVDHLLAQLKERKLLYKSEGAIWLKTKQFGDDKDRVLIKANEEPVYFLSDIAYHWNKFVERKFDKVINIWGADHHGYVGRMQAAMKMFGFQGKLDIIIVQLVHLMKGGKEYKMSKRSGTFVTLEELVDEVGVDATRFFFLMHDYTTHMDFDLDLAKKKSQDNPVFYVQYAHARICSIMRKVKLLRITKSDKRAIIEKSEAALVRTLIKWPEIVTEIAGSYQVNKLPHYAVEVATKFHEFYTKCKVINGKQVNERRLAILKAAQVVLQNVLAAMGISAPDRM